MTGHCGRVRRGVRHAHRRERCSHWRCWRSGVSNIARWCRAWSRHWSATGRALPGASITASTMIDATGAGRCAARHQGGRRRALRIRAGRSRLRRSQSHARRVAQAHRAPMARYAPPLAASRSSRSSTCSERATISDSARWQRRPTASPSPASSDSDTHPWSWAIKLLFTVVTLSAGFKGGEVTTAVLHRRGARQCTRAYVRGVDRVIRGDRLRCAVRGCGQHAACLHVHGDRIVRGGLCCADRGRMLRRLPLLGS